MIRFATNHLEWNLDDMLGAVEKELDVLEGYVPVFTQANTGGLGKQPEQYRSKDKPTTASALTVMRKTWPQYSATEMCLIYICFMMKLRLTSAQWKHRAL